jgi:hypothetical protein
MTLGGGNHGHAGIIMETAEYFNMTEGADFANPENPGIYYKLRAGKNVSRKK